MQPHIFILTLKSAPERRSGLIASLDQMKLPYEIWYGVDGRGKLPAEYEGMIDRPAARKNLHRDMADAEFACALSHNEIYQTIVEREIKAAIVLEDDACVGGQFQVMINALTPSPCELLLLDHKKGRVAHRDVLTLNLDLKAYRVVLPPELTTGYYLTQAAARKLIKATGKISGVADWPCDIASLDCRALMPRVVAGPTMEGEASQIHEQRKDLVVSNASKRFLTCCYWKQWWLKRTSKMLK